MEGAPKLQKNEKSVGKETIEQESERLLEELLIMPENAFLLEHENNRYKVETLPPVQALAFAMQKIEERGRRTGRMALATEVMGMDVDFDMEGIHRRIENILKHAFEIGRGGDAVVVIDKSGINNLPPDLCYKFALTETTPRGRNSTFVEEKIQEEFFLAISELPDSKIGVPQPFYAHEVGSHKVIAMEKLNAKSISDILRGNGSLPPWFNVEFFFDEIRKALDHFHSKGLYHRDMHEGNIMISQQKDLKEGDKIGYIIDFGLSVDGDVGIEPYKKEVAGNVFTYPDDYGIIESGSSVLRSYQKRTKSNGN